MKARFSRVAALYLSAGISMSEDQKNINFEQSMEQLEALVQKMESGQLSLEDSLKSFEQGIGLIRGCQKSLQEAKQRVSILVEENGVAELKPFIDDSPND